MRIACAPYSTYVRQVSSIEWCFTGATAFMIDVASRVKLIALDTVAI